MTPSKFHPVTGEQNTRYLTVIVAVKSESPDSAIKQAVNAFPLFESPSHAPDCEVTAISCGDALAELDSRT